MRLETIELDEAHCFSSSFLDYINSNAKLKKFYNLDPTIDNFEEQLKNKHFSKHQRNVLHNVLLQQYDGLIITSTTQANIDSLTDENTFTVTTGHQLNIFTGPLYFIYKIVTTINTAKSLKAKYPTYNFVPVYWMASEDHDFEEISYFRLEGKKYQWDADQKGAVGRFNPKSLKNILEALPGKTEIFQKAYLEHETLAEAVRYYVNALFEEQGLVIIDADNKELKGAFSKVMQEDIVNNGVKPIVDNTNDALANEGYSSQVYARDINFFYLDGDIRSRIVKEENRYNVLDSSISFSEKEMMDLITNSPEKLSLNVILRPLYQEMILPNLAYIGGPSEVTYWLQLKDVFEKFNTSFPLLMPRNYGLIVDSNTNKKMNKINFGFKDWFLNVQDTIKLYVVNNTEQIISYNEEIEKLKSVYEQANEVAHKIDPSLGQHLKALEVKATNLLSKAEKKLIRAEKKNHATKIKQIEAVKSLLFPNDNLQERTDNFLNFYNNNPHFIDELLKHFDPFNYKFHILIED